MMLSSAPNRPSVVEEEEEMVMLSQSHFEVWKQEGS